MTSKHVIVTQLPIGEATHAPCVATIRHEGVAWYCTRVEGHKDPTHVAHYDNDDGELAVGVAWVESDDEREEK